MGWGVWGWRGGGVAVDCIVDPAINLFSYLTKGSNHYCLLRGGLVEKLHFLKIPFLHSSMDLSHLRISSPPYSESMV